MRERPDGLAERTLVAALAEGWSIDARTADYLPVGAGSYHWRVVDAGATARFVTVDDLGADDDADRDAAFDRLSRAYGTALALHRDAGLDFVLAPVPTGTGAAVRRLTPRYALAVFPMVEGSTGGFRPHRPEDRAEVVDLLVELHRATPVVAATAPRVDLVLPGRDRLREALRELDREWTGGPYAEPARKVLSVHAEHVERLLAEFDRLVDQVRDGASGWVLTHGEPHSGNVMRTPAGLKLIDWDTVRIGPPERDLWMLTDAFARMLGEDPTPGGADVLDRYTSATGRSIPPAGLALYPLWWKLADIAGYTADLRRPHGSGEDSAAALTYLTGYLESRA